MQNVKHTLLILSGKGGVGKSSVSTLVAHTLVKQGYKVGLLDIDLCGPSIPTILGLNHKSVFMSSDGWVPVFADPDQRLAVMSIGFLIPDKSTAVVWRGPKKTATIKQFLNDVRWGQIDYLIIDTPPGTSDEHISVCQMLMEHKPAGAIIVTTPQRVSLEDVRKEISFCHKLNLPILGVVENMSGYKCPCCAEVTNIFSSGGGESLAHQLHLPFAGRIPIDVELGRCMEMGENYLAAHFDSPSIQPLVHFLSELSDRLAQQPTDMVSKEM